MMQSSAPLTKRGTTKKNKKNVVKGLDNEAHVCYNVDNKKGRNERMSTKREELLTRVVRVYGLEHEVTRGFAELCEDNMMPDLLLEVLCKAHEVFPYHGE